MESGVAEKSAGKGIAAGKSGMAADDLQFLCLLLSFALLLMRQGEVDQELAGMGLTARVDIGMGPTVAVESGKEVFEMGMTVGVLAGMGMTEGDQQILPLFQTSDLLVSL